MDDVEIFEGPLTCHSENQGNILDCDTYFRVLAGDSCTLCFSFLVGSS